MKLWRYIQGKRKGKEAHRIEIEAMKDPFLADALEGYEKTEGNHQREVARLQKRITSKSINKRTNHLKIWSIAASILIVVGAGTWLFLENKETTTIATTTNTDTIRDSVGIIPAKTSIAQATPSSADKKEVQKKEEKTVPVAQIPPPVSQEAKVPEESPVMMRTAAAEASVSDKVPVNNEVSTPQPVTGMQAYMDYIQRNIKRPTDEECKDVKGAVVVMFKIGQSGRPYNIRVTQGLCSSINKEAIRLIINGPDWKKSSTSDEATLTINF